jgi:hypothetical protein
MRDTRSIRCLTALRDASSARVLNLVAIEKAHKDNPEYKQAPLFDSPGLNSSIILKHRLRPDEAFLFDDPPLNATKIIIPFDKNDLRLGGTSLLYGQRGCLEGLREVGKYGEKSFARDKAVLDLLSELPSLDPFLLHEKIASSDITVADCYFELSKSDKLRMHEFVAGEITGLIKLALKGKESSAKKSHIDSTARLVSALLSAGAEDQLEPLRLTLMLGANEFRDGVFSWRGVLYYKWCSTELMPKIGVVAREITSVPIRRGTPDEMKFLNLSKKRLADKMAETIADVGQSLSIYDTIYGKLVHHGQPQVFRDFLLRAPEMFVELGEKLGGLAHIASFWRFRFPRGRLQPVDVDLAISIFTDFMLSVGLTVEEPAQVLV